MSSTQTENILKIQSTRFGELEVPASSVIQIMGGIIGFPGLERFVVLDYSPPFSWLHSIENPDLAFVVVDGTEFGDHYKVPIPVSDTELGFSNPPDFALINLVSVRPAPLPTTVNLKAPVLVNLANRKARQLVVDNPNYSTRMPLWQENSTAE